MSWFPGKNKSVELFSDPSFSTSCWVVPISYYSLELCKIVMDVFCLYPKSSVSQMIHRCTADYGFCGPRLAMNSVIFSHKGSHTSSYHLKHLVALLLNEYQTNQKPKFCLVLDFLDIITSILLYFMNLFIFKLSFNIFCFYSTLQYQNAHCNTP